MKLYLVRHGECTTTNGIYLGKGSDVSINQLGKNQISNLALKLFLEIKFENSAVFSSTLKRSMESALIISNTLKTDELKIDDRLDEIDFGEWEGLTYNEIMEGWPNIAASWYTDPFSVVPPKAEDFRVFYDRVLNFWLYLKSIKNDFDNVVIICHGGVIQLLSIFINNATFDQRWNFNIPRGEFVKYVI